MPFRRSHSHAARHLGVFVALALALMPAVREAGAQTFTKVVNAGNPITTMGGAPAGSFVGASWVDSDGDGDLDLFISQVGLFRNDGGGAFTRLPGAFLNMGAAIGNTWADMDNDGDLDCFLAGGAPNGSALYRNDGSNRFTKLTNGALADTLGNGAWACAFGDADLDGLVDVVTAAAFGFNNGDNPNRFLHNLGNGVFARVDSLDFVQHTGPYTIPTWSDFDGDGDPDLFISAGPANGSQGLDFLYRNRLESAPLWFQRITAAPIGTDLHDGQVYNWIDFDGDGDLDLYLTNYGFPGGLANNLYRNDGNGVFVKLTGAQAGPIVTDVQRSLASVWQDFDNDGDLDCYVTNAGGDPAKFYRNDGGTFVSLTFPGLTDPGPHWGATSGDYDGDGAVDLYVAGTSSTHGLFRNTTSNSNGWIDVAVAGVHANRSAIGAKIRVRATIGGQPRWQLREVSAQNSFGGESSLLQHFGLGDAAEADSVIVEWPGGGRTIRTGIASHARLLVSQDEVTAVESSLRSADVVGDSVRLIWWAPALRGVPVPVERAESGAWRSIGTATADGPDLFQFVDASVSPGGRYGYRLLLPGSAGPVPSAETWIDVPARLRLAIHAITPDPSRGRFTLTFDLPRSDAVSIEIFDVTGRLVAIPEVGSPRAGRHVLVIGGDRLAPGVYLVRLTQHGGQVSARATVVR